MGARDDAGRDGGLGSPAVGRFWRGFAAVVVALRFPIAIGWVAAAVAASMYLPAIATSNGVGGLIPHNVPAAKAEFDATRLFGEPLGGALVAVVQRDPHRFPLAVVAASARHALAVDHSHVTGIPGLLGALPVANTAGLFPGSRERSTTIITFLFFRPGMSTAGQTAGARAYAQRYLAAPQDHLVGITGPVPGKYEQGNLIARYLPWVEIGTVLAIAVIVGLQFRSIGAPLAALTCSGIAFFLTIRLVAWIVQRAGLTLPPDLTPVLAVLELGVTTDYAVFFLSGMRRRLAAGLGKAPAARHTTAEFAPIIMTAGLVVAAGIGSLGIAPIGAVAAFGPALAATVLIAMVVAVTLAPALIAIFGRLLYIPQRWSRPHGSRAEPGRTWRDKPVRVLTRRPVAALTVVACVAVLGAGGWGMTHLRLGFPLIRALPADAPAQRAQAAAAEGFAPGILAPTEVLVIGHQVARQQAALGRLEQALASRPGVAGVLGPADFPALQQGLNLHLLTDPSGGAVRYVLIQRTQPLEPVAISRIQALRRALPGLLKRAGLHGVRFEVGGETALAGEAIGITSSGLLDVGAIVSLVILVLLGIFLRALLAPVYLLAASWLSVLCALGLTAWVFQDLLGYAGVVYYVPFAAAVLLISLGSDYNVFIVGRIWEEARRRPLREAVAVAVPRASRTITTAALALAASFGLLALVPLEQFRQLAATMAFGILIDSFIVRSLLVPALVVLFGAAGQWPGRRSRAGGRPMPGGVRETPGTVQPEEGSSAA